jgi:hypothetical protein
METMNTRRTRKQSPAAPVPLEVTYTIDASPWDTDDIIGSCDSGDAESDRAFELDALRRAKRGEVWAWASVGVTATVTMAGHTFQGTSWVAPVSHKDEAAFCAESERYAELKDSCLAISLRTELIASIERGKIARKVLARLDQ